MLATGLTERVVMARASEQAKNNMRRAGMSRKQIRAVMKGAAKFKSGGTCLGCGGRLTLENLKNHENCEEKKD